MLYLTSTGFDTILGFDLDQLRFTWAMHITKRDYRFSGLIFNPEENEGPLMINKLHVNNVHCSSHGMYISGLRTEGLLHFNGNEIRMAVELPQGTHNAQPFRDGVLFNDTAADVLRYTGRGEGQDDRAMQVPTIAPSQLQNLHLVDSGIVRPNFARGLCVLSDRLVAGGSSPSTITIYDLAGRICKHQCRCSQCYPWLRVVALLLKPGIFCSFGKLFDNTAQLMLPDAKMFFITSPRPQSTLIYRLTDLLRAGSFHWALSFMVVQT